MRWLNVFVVLLGFLPVIGKESIERGIYATFIVRASQSATLSLASSGIVESIFVEVGDKVEKGDRLLQLKTKELYQKLQIAKATMEALEQKYQFITHQYERYQKSQMALDKNTLEKIKTEYYTSGFELKKARANYALQKELLDNATLYAPFSGVIVAKNVEVGEAIGGSPLLGLETFDKKAILEFDSKYFQEVKVGDKFIISLNGKKQEIPLVLNKVYPSINTKSKKAMAEALIVDIEIPSGTFGDGFIVE
ncbi:HlyD family efflux transporter periplasmic adaptor subunit [Helicobacter apodemus]|uniref:HlyD family efflux transporter periplasmic adaptor subunit n=1 Tax=Helicobacter apodemus TaxID=135569 RepID=A0A4U8UDZ0_9HELI|nr:HlyD family efflux transporter periplasmic adaptor subunit [Helicobacter apodemus]TLE15832.1 HlyD family efflux transporter periplasmic adaptor subunit [Helicobacter apodemus]